MEKRKKLSELIECIMHRMKGKISNTLGRDSNLYRDVERDLMELCDIASEVALIEDNNGASNDNETEFELNIEYADSTELYDITREVSALRNFKARITRKGDYFNGYQHTIKLKSLKELITLLKVVDEGELEISIDNNHKLPILTLYDSRFYM